MTRRSITHTTPNDDWLKAQVGKGKEYGAKSDLVNDLISKARADQEKIEVVRGMLIEAEQSGFVEDVDPERIRAHIKNKLQRGYNS